MHPNGRIRKIAFGLSLAAGLIFSALIPLRGQSNVQGLALPFPENEKLIYEIKLNRFPLYVTLGHITFEYKGPSSDRTIDKAALEMTGERPSELIRLRAEAIQPPPASARDTFREYGFWPLCP